MWDQRRLGFALLAAMSWSGPAAGLTVDVAFTASRFFPLLCYPARPAVGQPEAKTITGLWLIHALGVEPADVLAKEELCVPAEVTS